MIDERVVEGYFHLLKGLIALCLCDHGACWCSATSCCATRSTPGITVSEEVSRWLFVYLTFLGAIVALHEHGHLGVDMLVRRLP